MRFKMIENIWNHLGDDESRKLFDIRMKYSIERNLPSLMEDLYEYTEYEFEEWNYYIKKFDREIPILIWGTGYNGRYTEKVLNKLGHNVVGFIDNNSKTWGSNCFSVEKALDIYPEAIVFVAVSKYQNDIYKQLIFLNFDRNRIFMPFFEVMCGIKKNQYFDLEFLPHVEDEVFVDCGALDGKTSVDFIEWSGGKYKKIYMFEPGKDSIRRCKNTIIKYKMNDVELVEKGVWSCEDTLSFDDDGIGSAHITSNGKNQIIVDSIDNVLKGAPATFIKMDIEGSEYKGLIGAEYTIKR